MRRRDIRKLNRNFMFGVMAIAIVVIMVVALFCFWCLDYCGIGPQLATLGRQGRVEFTYARDDEALNAVKFFARNEGVLFAMESAHAGAEAIKLAPTLPKNKAIIVNMSGRGDKDVFITCPVFRRDEWLSFLHAEIDRLESDTDIHNAKIMGETK